MLLLDPTLLLVAGSFAVGIGAAWYVPRRLRRWGWGWVSREDRVVIHTIAERVRAVGKLVGLEVCAKEIATATQGWSWMPPLVLSQARLAMIFNFEKRYWADLSRVSAADVRQEADGTFRVHLPAIEGALRLIDVVPYDIQNARVLGLLDVIPMTADRQKALMARAQHDAAGFLAANDERYASEARASVERQLHSLLSLFGVRVAIAWRAAAGETTSPQSIQHAEPRKATEGAIMPWVASRPAVAVAWRRSASRMPRALPVTPVQREDGGDWVRGEEGRPRHGAFAMCVGCGGGHRGGFAVRSRSGVSR